MRWRGSVVSRQKGTVRVLVSIVFEPSRLAFVPVGTPGLRNVVVAAAI
jgi:hypothetical protein